MNLRALSTPRDLQKYNIEELTLLCQEIRQYIIDVVSRKGGHLASNLGVVELTVALHYVFNTPLDKIIFDVSHQCYPHKLLTGRYDRFPSLRQFLGLCGFSHPNESPYDHFYVGHAGTALSLALGMATARAIHGTKEHIVPIIGDAAFTCGLTLEALNNISKKLPHFIIILNDNNMSISNNVGAIPNILGKTFFESFGLSYQGPIDGHNLPLLIETLSNCKEANHPILIHAQTTKGQGMPIATENPISYHGCKPFDRETGVFVSGGENSFSFPQIFGKHLLEMAEKNPNIIAITPAMPAGSCLSAFMKKYPDRCLDVGIAEGHAVTFGGGIAQNKKIKVFISIYATFLQRALDNLFQDVCLQRAPVVFAIDRAGISGPDGSTHHGIYDISFLQAMPGMAICQPRNGSLLKELMESSLSWNVPCAIRYPNLQADLKENTGAHRPIGKGELLRQGKQIAIIALGHMCTVALDVCALLHQEGLTPTVIDPIFVKPLDEELLSTIFSTHKMIVTLEEHAVNSGLGMVINNFIIAKQYNHLTVLNLGIPDTFIDHGSHKELMESLGLSPEKIASTLLNHYSPCEAML